MGRFSVAPSAREITMADQETMFTLKEVLTLIVFIGGFIGTFWTLMWQLRLQITTVQSTLTAALTQVKDHLDEKREVEIKALYERINTDKKEVGERMDRNAATCRDNERELFRDMTEIKTKMVSEKNLLDMESNIESKMDARLAQLEAKIPQMMLEVLKTYKPSS